MDIAALKALTATLVEAKDADITLATFIVWANECSSDLAPVARKRVRATADWAGGEEFALPADLTELRRLTYDGAIILPENLNTVAGATSYTRWGSVIVFDDALDAAELTIHYYRKLTTFTLGTDVPELPSQFHRLYALFGASRFWKYTGDEPAKEQALRAEYESLKAQLDTHTLYEGGPRSFRMSLRW